MRFNGSVYKQSFQAFVLLRVWDGMSACQLLSKFMGLGLSVGTAKLWQRALGLQGPTPLCL